MKSKFLKSLLTFGAALLVSASLLIVPAAAEEDTITFTLRIEGIKSCLFYETVTVPSDGTPSLQEALLYLDEKNDDLTITGLDKAYITAINGETAATFGGWDGWLFRANDEEPPVGIDAYVLKADDSIVFFYGDPYGVGMQFPQADISKIADGIIRFTSMDTVYDEDSQPSTQTNPVKGATVVWKSGAESASYTTNDNGEIQIDAKLLTPGQHSVSISKNGDTELPLVLRLAPDFTVTVPESTTPPADTDSSDAPAPTPPTGDGFAVAGAAAMVALLSAGLVLSSRSKRS